MLLAGGQGTRLGILTKNVAKPAVPYGGKYRIIDFPLSNCTNSGIDVVGVLTQYRPLELNAYIGSGAPWDLDLTNGGVFVLPPYQTGKTGEWYRGTANAIYQNMSFIAQYDPDYVLILSGDHIYKMDYSAMLREHIKNDADVTIAVREVPWEEAPRFGILNTDEEGRITEFEEKPRQPKSNKASMGIYVFKWDVMKRYLTADNEDPSSSNDFGKNIIPKLIADGHRLFAFSFKGYWKDVGTIDSLWQSNMDILGEKPLLDMRENKQRIYSRNTSDPASYIAPGSTVVNSFVAEGSTVCGKVFNSVISTGCVIEADAEIHNSFVMPNTVIGKRSVVRYAIIGEDSVVHANARIGDDPAFYPKDQWGIAVVGKDKIVDQNMILLPNQIY